MDVAFRTEQRADFGPDGQECSLWAMTYAFVPDGESYLIDSATKMDIDDPNPQAC